MTTTPLPSAGTVAENLAQADLIGIVAKLKRGETLTGEERASLRAYQKRAAKSGADSKHKHISEHSTIDVQTYQASRRRKKCEKDFQLFCKTYLKSRFPLPNSADQIEMNEKIQHAALTGGMFAQSAPRGDGKTQRVIAATLWVALYGLHRYTVSLGATGAHGKRLVGEVIQELADNDMLAEDWPEICKSIRSCYGKANRANFLHVRIDRGTPTERIVQDPRLMVSANKLVLPTVPDVCDWEPRTLGGTVVEGAGITAAFRGIRHTTTEGETVRPSFVICDDIQTRKSAQSIPQTERILQILRGDIKRLAGPDKELACVANFTVMRKGDVADQLLDNKLNPQWRGVRKKMVYEWPKRKDLWTEYARLRRGGLLDGDGGSGANAFYKLHRIEMDEGGRVGWNARYRRDNGEVSAMQCAHNILIDDGEEAFAAECQNEPLVHAAHIYEITADIVCTRLNGLANGEALQASRCLTAFTDVNRYGLHWAVCSWQNDLTGNVAAYGVWPQNGDPVWNPKAPAGTTEPQALYKCLVELGQHMTRLGAFQKNAAAMKLDCWMIDVGYLPDTVFQYIRTAKVPTMVVPSRGWSSRSYRAGNAVRVGDHWSVHDWKEPKGNVLIHDADFHRMNMHAAWLLPNGSPGGLSLHGKGADGLRHRKFGEQICAERLAEHIRGDRFDHYRWDPVVGVRNDWLDCVVGCRVGACYIMGVSGQLVIGAAPAPQTLPSNVTTASPTPTAPAPAIAPVKKRNTGVTYEQWI